MRSRSHRRGAIDSSGHRSAANNSASGLTIPHRVNQSIKQGNGAIIPIIFWLVMASRAKRMQECDRNWKKKQKKASGYGHYPLIWQRCNECPYPASKFNIYIFIHRCRYANAGPNWPFCCLHSFSADANKTMASISQRLRFHIARCALSLSDSTNFQWLLHNNAPMAANPPVVLVETDPFSTETRHRVVSFFFFKSLKDASINRLKWQHNSIQFNNWRTSQWVDGS